MNVNTPIEHGPVPWIGAIINDRSSLFKQVDIPHMRRLVVLTIALLLLSSITTDASGQIRFEDGSVETVLALDPPSFDGVGNIAVPAGFYATCITMMVNGMAAVNNSSAYPLDVSLDIDGEEIWGFTGENFGALGRQDKFITGRTGTELEFGKGGGSSETRLRLPKNAAVRSAIMKLTSGPKFIKQELVNFSGVSTNDHLGESIAGAGDVNGDGYDDVILGLAEQVQIFFGGAVINQTSDIVLSHKGWGDHFGQSVCGAGDVNGDGYNDIVVGAPWGESNNGITHAGRAYLFLGGPAFDNQPDWFIWGTGIYDELGENVASAGDVNGDGFGDFLISDTASDKVHIVLGAADLNDMSILVLNIPELTFGISIAGAGDVNNDGYDDVLIGDPHVATGPESEGAVYVFLGGKEMDPYIDLTISENSRWAQLGVSVSGAGDLNQDGYDDIIVLAVQNNSSMPGAAYIYNGGQAMDNIPDFTLTGIWTMDGASPQSVACVGDVNGDGSDDTLVGAYYESTLKSEAGAAYLYYGGTGMDAKADWAFAGAAAGDHFGYAVAGVKDINNDGFDDFIISAPNNSSGAQNAGQVYLYTLFNATTRGPLNSSLTIGAKPVWRYPGVFNFGSSVTTGDFADELNQYLRAAPTSGQDVFGNEYVDVPLVGYAMTEGTLKLSNLSIVYDCDFEVGDFAPQLNQYLKDNQDAKDPEGNILVPLNLNARSAGRVKLSGLNISRDLPPVQVGGLEGLMMDEDTAKVNLVDLRDYFTDDVDSPANLTFSVVSATNSTYVRLWITVNRYLSVDAMTGDANDNWTGTVEVAVGCTDHWGQKTLSRPFTITVRNVNDAPVIVSEPVLEARTGVPYYYNASAVDGDNDPLVFSLAEAPVNMSIDASSGRITWVPERKGLYGVTVVASDGTLSGSQSFEIYVPNSAPRIMDATVPEALVGVPWNFTVPAVDDDGDTLAFSIVAGMEDMTIDSGTGMLSWTPPEPGNYTVTVGVSDGEANVSRDFVIAVVQGNRVPVFTSEPARNATIGLLYVYEAKAVDMDSDAVVFSIVSGPPGMTVDGSTGVVSWTPAAAGNFTVRLLAVDGKGGEAFQEFTVKVEPKVLPTVNIATPSEGQKVRGEIAVAGNVTRGTLDVVKVQVRVDDGEWKDVTGNSTWEFRLDTKGLKNGPHALQVRAFDGQDYSMPVNRTVVVDNPSSGNGVDLPWLWIGAAVVIVLAAALVAGLSVLRRRK